MTSCRTLFIFFATVCFFPRADAEPLTVGDTFTVESEVLGETRRINVFVPTRWGEKFAQALPVLYMPDGGMAEDFLHIAGLLQVSVSNGTMRPFMLVGIENTQRKRDLTGPTTDERDLAIAPEVGGSEPFRKFLRDELFPHIESHYETTDERAIIGESLAGLFIVETLLKAPELFDTWIAIDPSLWWNHNELTKNTASRFSKIEDETLFIAAGQEAGNADVFKQFIDGMRAQERSRLDWHYLHLPEETHATVYHPAALAAVRLLFAPATDGEASE